MYPKRTIEKALSRTLLTVCLLSVMTVAAHGIVPQSINYQGKLIDDVTGDPLAGPVELTFRIFDAEVSGHLMWEETHDFVDLKAGVYNVLLGEGNTTVGSFDADLFRVPGRWLEVTVAVGMTRPETLSPRQPLSSVAFALKAADADTLTGLAPEDFGDIDEVRAGLGLAGGGPSGSVTLNVGGGTGISVSSNEVALDTAYTDPRYVNEGQVGAVTAAMIADGAVQSGHIRDGAVMAEILDDDGSGSQLDADTLDGRDSRDFGDIDGVSAGMGLAGGGSSGNVTLDVVGGTGISVASDILHLDTAYTDIRYVNAAGDTMNGGLTINADLSVVGSSVSSVDFSASFESSGGSYASAIKGVANATTSPALGLDIDVSSASSNATGIAADVNASNLNATGALFTVDTYSAAVGIEADANSSHGIAYGARLNSTAGDDSSQSAFGIYSLTEHDGSGNIYGIQNLAHHNGATGDGYGLYTELTGSLSGDATGVYAKANVINNASSGETYGGYFIADDDRSNGLSYGVLGEATGANNERTGVYGRATYSGDGEPNIGIVAEAASSDYYAYGFYADVNLTTSSSNGAYGADINVDASSSSNGQLYGLNSDVTHNGAYGNTYGLRTTVQPSGNGNAYGVYSSVNSAGTTGLSYAGYFDGRVEVTGPLVKGGGSFKIDHPLDPENKILQHSFVESPDMMNVYNGNLILNEQGEAWVDLPDYFEALNRDFRYQLTCIGNFAQVYIAEEISENRFKIAGGRHGLKVSWQVTGIRHDAWAEANRIEVEVDKDPKEQGTYLHPDAFGLDETRRVESARHPAVFKREE